jgi:hypothetical protein
VTPITNIEDLRRIAKRRVPKVMFEYVDSDVLYDAAPAPAYPRN